MKRILKEKSVIISCGILFLLYIGAVFAPFFSPYPYDEEDIRHIWAPPTKIHFFDLKKGIFFRPFIHPQLSKINKYYRRLYYEDKTKVIPIRFFVHGFKYKLLGIWETDLHLFGVEEGKIYLLGADNKGRDIFTRILYGARISLSIGIIASLISFFIGMLVGGVSGYFSGKVDTVLMRIVEMFMMIPSFYLMLALRASFPPNLSSTQVYFLIVVILSFVGWASTARIIRGMALSLREREYVYAAKALGVSDFKIIIRHILPHTFSYALVAIVLSIPGYILGEAALSLLGLGIQEPEASWGNLLSSALSIVKIKLYPWMLTPGIFIVVATLCFNIVGDYLRDVFDPKSRKL